MEVLRRMDGVHLVDSVSKQTELPSWPSGILAAGEILLPINAPGMGRFKLFDLVG